jgi:hypothetical protein
MSVELKENDKGIRKNWAGSVKAGLKETGVSKLTQT